MTTNTSPGGEDGDRQKLLQAAVKRFAERGYDGTSLRALAIQSSPAMRRIAIGWSRPPFAAMVSSQRKWGQTRAARPVCHAMLRE